MQCWLRCCIGNDWKNTDSNNSNTALPIWHAITCSRIFTINQAVASETREPDIRQDGKAAATSQHAGCSALRCQSPAKAGLWLWLLWLLWKRTFILNQLLSTSSWQWKNFTYFLVLKSSLLKERGGSCEKPLAAATQKTREVSKKQKKLVEKTQKNNKIPKQQKQHKILDSSGSWGAWPKLPENWFFWVRCLVFSRFFCFLVFDRFLGGFQGSVWFSKLFLNYSGCLWSSVPSKGFKLALKTAWN